MCTRSSSARVAARGSSRRRASGGAPRVEPLEHGPHARRALGMARDRRRAPRSGGRSRPAARPRLTTPLAIPAADPPRRVPVATLAAGEGAQGAVVPISWRRRPGRGVARTGRRRLARAARLRRALAPHRCDRLLERLHEAGYREVVTNALGPGDEPPARRRRASRSAAGCTCSRTTSSDLPRRAAATRRRARAPIATRCSRPTRPRSTSSGASTRDALARRHARRRARTSASRRRSTARAATGCSVAPDAAGYVQRLAVAPAAQGRGSGAALLDRRPALAAAHGAQRVYVNTQEDNDRALALYQRAGFTQLPVGLYVLGREL